MRIRLSDAEPAAGGPDNRFRGEVTLASFMGSHMQYRVRAERGMVWDVFCPGTSDAVRIGSRVVLEVAPSSLRLVPRS